MTSPILAGYCPRTADHGPVDLAAELARLTGAPLIVTAVHSGGDITDEPWMAEHTGLAGIEARKELERLRVRLGDLPGVDLQARLATSAASGLHAAIEDFEPGLVVVGSTRRGPLGRVLPGSTAERVIHGATCPVVVTPSGFRVPEGRMGVIGAAFAPTPEGRNALRVAAALATSAGARLRAIMALDPRLAEHQSPGMLAKDHHEHRGSEDDAAAALIAAERALDEAIAEVPEGVETERDVLFLDPADGLTAASEQLDLLVMGSRGYGPLRAVMLGGVTRRMISRAACPLLILPRGLPGGLDAFKLTREAAPPVGG